MQPFSFMTSTSFGEYELSEKSTSEIEELLEKLRKKITSADFCVLPAYSQYHARKQHVVIYLYLQLRKEVEST